MSNPHRGEASFEADGKTYTLHLDFNAICEAETAAGVSIAQQSSMGFRTIRALAWAGLIRHHRKLPIDQVGELIQAAGVEVVTKAVMTALAATFPKVSEAASEGNAAAAQG